ncbi:MAG: adenylosuccinate synthase [bacterium]|nr:adenylosuccinate synthase [bacterium]
MPVTIVVGAQWGDEGKGKIVDYLAQQADVVVRFNGGNNAGHTIKNAIGKFALHLMPAGVFNPDTVCVIERGVVIHLPSLITEMDELAACGVSAKNLAISPFAHLVMPWHLAEEQMQSNKGQEAIGTTLRGIGPCYQDKASRRHAFRVCDLLSRTKFLNKLEAVFLAKKEDLRKRYGKSPIEPFEKIRKDYLVARDRILPHVADTFQLICGAASDKKHILLEGAQGTLLDVDYGSYPYVTSSNATAMGACMLTGVAPRDVTRIIGVAKAYVTRVGNGPFPTEIKGRLNEKLRKLGNEFGATTGRPRRCGWLDLHMLAYAVRVNHLTEIALTKSDILGLLPAIKVCEAYITKDPWDCIDTFGLESVKPDYETYAGWGDLKGCSVRNDLPEEFRRYLSRIEKIVPMNLISTGSGRDEIITA